VPRDVSIVGFDDIPESAHFWPPLTTVRQEFSQVGEECVAMLVEAIGRREGPAGRTASTAGRVPVVEPRLIVRGSVAPA
jgi:DNA-binding LacI/PurR family transcriptional regulator